MHECVSLCSWLPSSANIRESQVWYRAACPSPEASADWLVCSVLHAKERTSVMQFLMLQTYATEA